MNSGLHTRGNLTKTLLRTRTHRVLALLLAWLIVRETSLRTNGFEDGPILCPVRLLTGFSCPGCGGTRAMGAISTGQFEQAWSLNPITFAVCLIAITWAVQIKTLNRLIQQSLSAFRSQPVSIQVLSISILYALAWIAAISRSDSGIL
jgi:hypothetical protein